MDHLQQCLDLHLQSVSLIDSKHFALFGLNLIGNVGLSILALMIGRTIMTAIRRTP